MTKRERGEKMFSLKPRGANKTCLYKGHVTKPRPCNEATKESGIQRFMALLNRAGALSTAIAGIVRESPAMLAISYPRCISGMSNLNWSRERRRKW